MSDSLRPRGLYSPWNSPGQNTGVGSISLLQGIFPTQESNQGLLRCRWILYQLNYKEAHHSIDPLIIRWDLQSSNLLYLWFLLHLLAEILEETLLYITWYSEVQSLQEQCLLGVTSLAFTECYQWVFFPLASLQVHGFKYIWYILFHWNYKSYS